MPTKYKQGDFLDELNETFDVDAQIANVNGVVTLDTKFSTPSKNVIHHLNMKRKPEFMANLKLFVMSTNVLCKVEHEYIPIEISILEYSLKRGITRAYHRYVHPTEVPFGYRAQANRHSQTTHQLPVEDWLDESTDNFGQVLKEIVDFLGFDFSKSTTHSHLQPFIVCSKEQIAQNRRVLKYICDQASAESDSSTATDITDESDIQDMTNLCRRVAIVDIIDFVIVVLKALNRNSLYNSVRREFEQTKYDYEAKNTCEFHQIVESNFCSRGVARKNCLLLTDYLGSAYEMEHLSGSK